MKPVLEHLPLSAKESFVVKPFCDRYYPAPWHFHPEYELALIKESSGKRFIGDNISDFDAGDLAFLGPNLPHLYRNDAVYYEERDNGLRARSIIVHFSDRTLGHGFFDLPETKKIARLFQRSARGLQVKGKTKELVIDMMEDICQLEDFKRWMKLLEILQVLSDSNELEYISNQGLQGKSQVENQRMHKIFEYVMNNFRESLTLAHAAALANLTENSFSRYFSQHTGKSFTAFVNEIRLNHACKLLIENRLSITDICFECGFNNLSNFHRQFKNKYGSSPIGYRKTVTGMEIKYDRAAPLPTGGVHQQNLYG